MDLRERVVAAVDAGITQPQAATRFGVSLRTVERYLARRRVTGSLAATEQRHGPEPTVRRALQAWLPDRLAAAADATLAEHVAAFVAAGGEPVSLAAMSPGTLVVVDNVGAHQPDRIGELVAAAGCELVFLPAYSPDLSPIEEAFSKIKALVKAAAARTRAALD